MKRKALIAAINSYHRRIGELRGCVNDAGDFEHLLHNRFSFSAAEIHRIENQQATRQAILEGLDWLMEDASKGDVRIFFYAGHGTQLPNAEDPSGRDEALVGYSAQWDGLLLKQPDASLLFDRENWELQFIRDKELKAVFDTIPDGVNLTLVFDCCHSGDMQKLSDMQRFRFLPPPHSVEAAISKAEKAYWKALQSIQPSRVFVKPTSGNRFAYADTSEKSILLAACSKDESAMEATIAGKPRGVFTYHLADQLRKMSSVPSYGELAAAIGNQIHYPWPAPWLACPPFLKSRRVFS